jgi:hypothetical protein
MCVSEMVETTYHRKSRCEMIAEIPYEISAKISEYAVHHAKPGKSSPSAERNGNKKHPAQARNGMATTTGSTISQHVSRRFLFFPHFRGTSMPAGSTEPPCPTCGISFRIKEYRSLYL